MKKKIFGSKFSRAGKSRKALFRSLTRSLVLHGVIITTSAKAKAVQFYVENIINIAKENNIAARRRVYAKLGNDKITTDGIFNKILLQYKPRVGGYLRIVPMPPRRGDASEMARVEWVEKMVEDKKKEDKSEKSEAGAKTENNSVVGNKGLKRILKKPTLRNKNNPSKSAVK